MSSISIISDIFIDESMEVLRGGQDGDVEVQENMEILQGRIKFLDQTSAFTLINIGLRLAPMKLPSDAGVDQTFAVGQIARFRALFKPPDGVDEFTFEWDFGDGSPPVTGNRTAPTLEEGARITATVTHVYRDDSDSPFIVEFEIMGRGDTGVAEGSDTLLVAVTKLPTITVFAGENQIMEEGEEVEFLGSFTRPKELRDLTFRWEFGDAKDRDFPA